MVYINSKGEVVDENANSVTNIFWKIITFFVMFFKSLIGIEDAQDKKNDRNSSGRFHGGGGRPDGGPKDTRKFGPRGFKSITDLAPPPPPMGGCAGGACG